MAMGNRIVQAKRISWSYLNRGSVPRIQIKMNRMANSLAKNQNNEIKIVCTTGTRNDTANSKANPSETTPTTGNVYLSILRAGALPAISNTKPVAASSTTG